MNQRIIIGIFVLIGTAACIAWYVHSGNRGNGAGLSLQQEEGQGQEASFHAPGEPEGKADSSTDSSIYVYVCGEVKHAGVYELSATARVSEAVEAAGGFTKKADTEAVNLARIAVDAEQIMIPRKTGRMEKSTGNPAYGAVEDSGEGMMALVNINTADENMLMSLGGIGQAKAEAIIAYRTEQGAFARIEDITKVPGIKDGIYNQIKDKICV